MRLLPAIPARSRALSVLALFALPCLLLCAGTARLSGAPGSSDPVVAVTGGAVRGRLLADGRGAVFKGIPFAQPPVGELRWREPMPVVAWTGIRDAG
jgi:para-nitrobenzyl esterase